MSRASFCSLLPTATPKIRTNCHTLAAHRPQLIIKAMRKERYASMW
ncbi:hypothetical protein JI435_408500 [Parastagonospora nodorum SN15]|uniref:Uncharacterized protein n=1 Tax=Phaeosphaeria nodorum (strain SN15 / ATCC MYA-4574 / FGSC 10173) TaxID=321614 RepID=A0A7U2F475_PHANO|nr:hypothetical protein JI435_408500 [Parastagonospora nodorum SN15]